MLPGSTNQEKWERELGMPSAAERLQAQLDVEAAGIANAYVPEASYKTDEVLTSAENSLDFLAGMLMPLVFAYCYPPVMKAVWALLTQAVRKNRDFTQIAIGLPRGHGKTTLIKIFIVFVIFFTKRKFILVTCSTAALAENIISDVADMLSENNVLKVFGNWKMGLEKDTQELKKFSFRGRPIILAAIGAEGSLRGLNIKNERPDVMIFEDIQTRENANSKVQADALETWMVGTAMKAKSPAGCLFIYVGNMYPTVYCILRKLKDNPNWIKFISGAILADGQALWEELQPLEQLKKELLNDIAMGHPEIFFAEVLNDPDARGTTKIDLTKLQNYPIADNEVPQGKMLIIDPATGKNRASDLVTIGYFEVYDQVPVLREIEEGNWSPGDSIRHALLLCLKHRCRVIGVEANAYQYTLLYWFEFMINQMELQGMFELVEVYSGSYSKNSRIAAMLKQLGTGEILVHPNCRLHVVKQAMDWNPMKKTNIDGLLDVLAYSPKMLELYAPQIATPESLVYDQQAQAATVRPEYETCEF